MTKATNQTDTTAAITLEQPIQRGETSITALTLRKPKSGELRGVKLGDVLQLDAGALMDLLPRITEPPITPVEAAALDPADLLTLGGKVVGFFLPRAGL